MAAVMPIAAYAAPEGFDFTHVNLAVEYFESPANELIERIAETEAASHLKRHSDRTGYFSPDATARSITEELLAKPPSPETLEAVKELVDYAVRDPDRQRECMSVAASYLPEEAQPSNSLHATWGYDIGVSMDDHASLNFAHPRFLIDNEEIWFYCIHEGHHSGLMRIHPMPRVADIDTVGELYEFTRYATFLEGLAVHAARDARREAKALASDRDYVALEDEARLERILAQYRQQLSYLESQLDQPLHQKHWNVVEFMSSGERLWYVAGAAMAASIEESLGLNALLRVILDGPEAFFEAYENLAPGD